MPAARQRFVTDELAAAMKARFDQRRARAGSGKADSTGDGEGMGGGEGAGGW